MSVNAQGLWHSGLPSKLISAPAGVDVTIKSASCGAAAARVLRSWREERLGFSGSSVTVGVGWISPGGGGATCAGVGAGAAAVGCGAGAGSAACFAALFAGTLCAML